MALSEKDSEDKVDFPEDGEDAWKELIDWCHTGSIKPLEQSDRDAASDNSTSRRSCWIRLKLCCLADKYGITLLHNLAMDTIIDYFKGCGSSPFMDFDNFSVWSSYVYDNTPEQSGTRDFIAYYFYYELTYKVPFSFRGEGKRTPYAIDDLDELSHTIPDLQKRLFSLVRQAAIKHFWLLSPCTFHNHSTPGVMWPESLECPISLTDPVGKWPEECFRIQYYIQDRTLKGTELFDVRQVATELKYMNDGSFNSQLERLNRAKVITWVAPDTSFKLTPPSNEIG
ncbi:uncharacterized protein LY89DRAFT_24253 [Mollisia scopiformis]|uniref:Uncharacterized protein n=1 Tax=Mollisia scopiformis TaxID=149040 RepID=A0A194XWM6_MOLSC|nr:uncharacterized protein LY89DRAFT_24253 [Mollisia scopiformis]KUJ24536.1 hypothetical protein LY89DRAFT_24253 [Mollisia scopiformis]